MAEAAVTETPETATDDETAVSGGGASPLPEGGDDSSSSTPDRGGDATLMEGGDRSEDVAAPTPAKWPSDWRDQMSGGDEKALNYLNRYSSPDSVVKALMQMRAKMDSGDMRRAKPEGRPDDPAYQEELKLWRQEIGVPDDPKAYLDNLPEGIVIGEEDEMLASSFIESMHGKDAPPEFVHEGLRWYYDTMEQKIAEQVERDRETRKLSEDTLREKYGNEFRPNINGLSNMLDATAGEGFKDRLFSARFSDGTLMGDDPEFIDWMVGINRELNPHGTVTPAAGQTAMQTIETELESLRGEMRDKNSDYYHNEGKQERYRELLDIEAKLKARG